MESKTIGLRVFKAINDLKIAVEVGFVVGVTPQITPTGSAIFVKPVIGSSSITPTVLTPRILFTTCSQANRFFVALSSNTPRPVSSTACCARIPCASSAATEALPRYSQLALGSTCAFHQAQPRLFFHETIDMLFSSKLFFPLVLLFFYQPYYPP